MAIASLSSKKFGVHKNVVMVQAETLEEAEYKLKTSGKVSKASYKNCLRFPIHGSGQGSSNSPYLWLFVSSVLFDVYETKSFGMNFKTPAGDYSYRMAIIGLVDDTTCSTDADPTASVSDLIKRVQHDAQIWHDLLWCSGGKLETSKCGYHLTHYNF